MPIGNQEIWDKGIGAGATNVIFGQQPQRTNFNPGALGADPNAQAAPIMAESPSAAIDPDMNLITPDVQSPQVPPNFTGQMNGKYYRDGKEVSYQEYISGNGFQQISNAGSSSLNSGSSGQSNYGNWYGGTSSSPSRKNWM